MNKNVLVTGAAGFVGTNLLPNLYKAGYKVTAIIKNENERRRIKIPAEIIVHDLSNEDILRLKIKRQDIIIHLAAQISSKSKEPFIKNNVEATRNLVEIAKMVKAKKIILFSSAAVTSKRLDWYAQTKQEKEEIIKNSKLNYVIIRPSMIYGPGDDKNLGWMAMFIKKVPVIPIPGNGLYGRQPVYVEDLCKIVVKIARSDKNKKVYEIHGKDYVTLLEMIKVIQEELNLHKKIVKIPLRLMSQLILLQEKIFISPKFTADQINSLTSGEKFKGDDWWNEFEIKPTNIKKGIHKMLNSK